MKNTEKMAADQAQGGFDKATAGVIVQCEGKFLILTRPQDEFMAGLKELPSGHVETAETLPAAALRELAEETGISAPELSDYVGYFDYTSGSGKRARQFTFSISLANEPEVTLTEHDAYEWLTKEEVLATTCSAEVKELIKRC